MEKSNWLMELVKMKHCIFVLGFMVFGLFFTTAISKEDSSVTLSGYIVCEEDDDGKVTSCKLKVTTENDDGDSVTKEYPIHADENGKKLFKYDYKDVKITGTVKKNKDKKEVLTVKSFEEVKKNK
jgi:hypothetical protein